MLPRLFIAIGLICLAALCVAAPTACSSSQRRDQYYGTDQGSDYQPEAGVFDGSSGDAEDSDDGGDGSLRLDRPLFVDAPFGLDAPTQLDAPEQPDAPVNPDAPEQPDTPVNPDAPEQPDAPAESDGDLASQPGI